MKKPADPRHIEQLSLGQAECANLGEFLQVDFVRLLGTLIDKVVRPENKTGVLRKMQFFSQQLLEARGGDYLHSLSSHTSDTVRGLAVFGLAHAGQKSDPVQTPDVILGLVRPFAADRHWAVREWAWMAVRPALVQDLQTSIALLSGWTAEADVNLRRFAVEALRPRGVWCKHIVALRQNPALGLALLEPMRMEKEKYAQDSVANWLNDAAKDKPGWVRDLCQRWQKQVPDNPATARIIRRALRSVTGK